MNQSIYKLDCSKLLSVPYLNDVLYLLQIYLVEWQLLHHCWISRKNHPLRQRLLSAIQKRAQTTICSAWQLGRQLTTFNATFIFDYTGKHPKYLSLAELYAIEWALILAQSVTLRSIKYLGSILPESYPVWAPYIISVHQPLNVQSDFVWQTVKQLSARGASVTVLSHVEQPVEVLEKIRNSARLNYISTQLPSFLLRLPYQLQQLANGYWEEFIKYSLRKTSASLSSPVWWCFDPDDTNTLRFRPPQSTVVYDCVDYYESLDPKLQKRIEKDQKKLIHLADLMFVNSHSLLTVHQKLRQNITLVPQGFDDEVFLSKKQPPLSTEAKKFFAKIQREKKKYRAVVSYVGTLSHRIDFSLLYNLIKKNPKLLFCLPSTVLPWPSEDLETNWEEQLSALQTLSNVVWFPQLSRNEVRALLEKSTVGLIPYNDKLLYNKFCFPMKFFEYMSVGIPTLATQIQELKQYPKFAQTSKNLKEMSQQLRKLSKKKYKRIERAEMQKLAKEHSWKNKVTSIVDKISAYQRRYYRFG